MNALPQWIDREAWDGFVEMRKRQEAKSRGKIVWTQRAETLVLKELYALKAKGHDPNAALDQSTLKGWTDVYAPTAKDTADMSPRKTFEHDRPMTPEEKTAADEARRRVMGAIRRVA